MRPNMLFSNMLLLYPPKIIFELCITWSSCILLWVKVGVTLVTDSDFISRASLHRHFPLRTRVTNQTATSPTMMPSVELKENKKDKWSLFTEKTYNLHHQHTHYSHLSLLSCLVLPSYFGLAITVCISNFDIHFSIWFWRRFCCLVWFGQSVTLPLRTMLYLLLTSTYPALCLIKCFNLFLIFIFYWTTVCVFYIFLKKKESASFYFTTTLVLPTHHGEPLTLADHADMLQGVRDPVLTGWRLVWRLELSRRATFSPCWASILLCAVWGRCVCRRTACIFTWAKTQQKMKAIKLIKLNQDLKSRVAHLPMNSH